MNSESLLIQQTRGALQALMEDPSLPPLLRHELVNEYQEVERYLKKLESGELHIAIFGRVSVGKSSLANALMGRDEFAVSPLHGETKQAQRVEIAQLAGHPIVVVDTPGIDEVAGETRAQLAVEAAKSADLVIVVVDSDLTQSERAAIEKLAQIGRPMLLALNKADRYSAEETSLLLERLREHTSGLVKSDLVIAIGARPAPQRVIEVSADGSERERTRTQEPQIQPLRDAISRVVRSDGDTIKALSAGLYAAGLSDQIAKRTIELKAKLGDQIIRSYALAKGVAVALTPVPLADLAAAAASDVALILHLSRLYGLPMTKAEAISFVATVATQLAALFGALWGIHIASSALKGLSGGLSTALTAGFQGGLAFYGAYIVGRAAERYLENGKSWGESGPKTVLQDLLASIDRNSILQEAKEQITARIRRRN